MHINGRYNIPAHPDHVWDAIQDPKILKACITGCDRIERVSHSTFEISAHLKIGPLKRHFTGHIDLLEEDPPHRCIMRGEGHGSVAGLANGQAEVLLKPHNNQTLLTYNITFDLRGALAKYGQKIIDGAAGHFADIFFARFIAQMGDTVEAPASPQTPSAPPPPLPEQSHPIIRDYDPDERPFDEPSQIDWATPPHSHAREAWVIGLVGVSVIMLILFGIIL